MKYLTGLAIILFATQGHTTSADGAAASTIRSFETLFGVTEGKRRNHTKGFCFEATLTPTDSTIAQYTYSPLFAKKSSVIGRLSHKGGNSKAADNKPGEYGMGLSISTTSGDTHIMSMNTLDFFPVATPEAFAELNHAKTQGPDAVKAFKQKNADLQRFGAHMSTKDKTLTPYEGTTFNSVNSFYLVDSNNNKTAIRWSFEPVQPQQLVQEPKQDFLFENMQQNLNDHDIVWNMVVTIANKGDAVNNAALPWAGEHEQIVTAKLKVLSISPEEDGQCEGINYDPLVLSPGFEPSADPLLQARRNAYAISFGKRTAEKYNAESE